MKPRIFVICPDMGDATSFYRGVGPLGALSKSLGGSITLMMVELKSWATISMSDVVFLQRPFKDKHLAVVEMAKACNVPVWIDYDDDLFQVPMDNPAFDLYDDADMQKRIAKMIAMADVVTVTTEHLKERLAKLNQNIVVIPNAFDERFFSFPKERDPRKKLVLWRGSSTHQKDLATVGMELIKLSHDPQLSDWTFHFLGFNPWWIVERMRPENTIISPGIDILEYHQYIKMVNPSLLFVPLCNNAFNRSKSNIAWIEGTYAGAMVVAPELPEFTRPGVKNYKDPASFLETMKTAMMGETDIALWNRASQRYIESELRLSHVNMKRRIILEDLLKAKIG